MTLDIFILLLSAAIAAAAIYGLSRIKGIHLLAVMWFTAGGAISAFTAFLACYPLLEGTRFIVLPGIIGFALWAFFALRLALRHTSSMRRISPPAIH